MNNRETAKWFYLYNQSGGGSTSCDGVGRTYNGSSEYSYIVDPGTLDIADATTDFCLSLKVKAISNTSTDYVVGKNIAGGVAGRYGIYYSGSYNFGSQPSGGFAANNIGGSVGNEYHFLIHIDITNTKKYYYRDGVLVNAGGTAYVGTWASVASNFEFYVGAGNSSGGDPANHANVLVKDVRIYHKDVSASLTELQAGESLGGEVAWWCLPSGVDLSGNTGDLTTV